jgi:hypothetical protein
MFILLSGVSPAAFAQKIDVPKAGSITSPPRKVPAARVKSCSSMFGAGFVNVPGTDACIKVGGSVTIEGGH